MMKAFALALCLAAAPAAAAELHFAPAENLEAIDVGLIGQARKTVDIAVYAFTSTPVINALAEAGARGVTVRVYRDHTQPKPIGMVAEALDILGATPNVTIRFKSGGPIMHLKAYAIDGTLFRSGSANFTHVGLTRQDNDLSIDRDPGAVAAFERDFETMWGR